MSSFPLPLVGRTRRYQVDRVDGTVLDVEAEGMWPSQTCVEFGGTVLVYGLPRWVCVQRVALPALSMVTRDDGAVWTR